MSHWMTAPPSPPPPILFTGTHTEDEHVCFIVGGGEVVLLVAGLVLPYQCFGCGVIDVEDGGGLV